MESIFKVLGEAALLQKAGCGLGFPLHLLRPTGSQTLASGGQSSGPISFLHVYNTAFAVIKQQSRHGANMAVMSVDHPDILEFVHCKEREGAIRNFNISVGLTNDFMQRVRDNDPKPYRTQFNGVEYPLRRIKRDTDQYTKYEITNVDMTARELFAEIVKCAWSNGEPGCVFLDRVNEDNPLPQFGRIHSSNPCGEQFLHDGDVCNLGALVLSNMVTPDGKLDEETLMWSTAVGIRMLDNVIDTFEIPVDRVQSMARRTRRSGLGVMGYVYSVNIPSLSFCSFLVSSASCRARSSP